MRASMKKHLPAQLRGAIYPLLVCFGVSFAAEALAQYPQGARFRDAATYWQEVSRQQSVKVCNEGAAQSPVDLRNLNLSASLRPVAFSYADYPESVAGFPATYNFFRMTDNGHTVELELAADDYRNVNLPPVLQRGATVDGVFYELQQLHFHAPSEHKVNGGAFPAELHIVHQAADKRRLVVAVFLAGGQANNDTAHAGLKPILDNFPQYNRKGYVPRNQVRLTQLLPQPAGTNYVRYNGSLTTPPCTENVTWIVFRDPIVLSWQQMRTIESRYQLNARPVQPTNARVLQTDKQ